MAAEIREERVNDELVAVVSKNAMIFKIGLITLM
jgi:hypothetical protein